MANSPALTPDSPPSLTPSTPPSTRRILIWRHEVHTATTLHPTPPLPAPQGTWRRLEKRIRGKIWTGKGTSGRVKSGKSGNGYGSVNWGMMEEEEEREETRMYELSERERAKEQKVVVEAGKAEEWSWDGGGRESGSTGEEGEEGKKRRGDEKEARLERAAELLGRQGKGGG
ncbi:hypothetical protein VE02_05120 [Pseudogymnoascus sp. 03VT05]|nr:hypothetical protein VE02_05120 [Pseudogymnoascus sp. 03VT05]